jgi:hypothetical protein
MATGQLHNLLHCVAGLARFMAQPLAGMAATTAEAAAGLQTLGLEASGVSALQQADVEVDVGLALQHCQPHSAQAHDD